MNKTMLTLEAGDFDAQLIGDYLGKRYAPTPTTYGRMAITRCRRGSAGISR